MMEFPSFEALVLITPAVVALVLAALVVAIGTFPYRHIWLLNTSYRSLCF